MAQKLRPDLILKRGQIYLRKNDGVKAADRGFIWQNDLFPCAAALAHGYNDGENIMA